MVKSSLCIKFFCYEVFTSVLQELPHFFLHLLCRQKFQIIIGVCSHTFFAEITCFLIRIQFLDIKSIFHACTSLFRKQDCFLLLRKVPDLLWKFSSAYSPHIAVSFLHNHVPDNLRHFEVALHLHKTWLLSYA